jgi:hypothetical protein
MPETTLQTVTRQNVTERKFSLLFFFLVAYLVLYPYAQHTGAPYLAFRVFGTVVTVLCIYAVSFQRKFVWFALVLAIPALVHRILLTGADAGALPSLSIVFGFAFDVFIVSVIFHRVFVQEEPTKEAIFGSLCIYLLVGFSFASIYGMLTAFQPDGFYLDPAINSHSVPDRFDLIYYSFTTLTCLGGAGITPRSTQARSISLIEALLGILYLAVLISRLLAAYHARHNPR